MKFVIIAVVYLTSVENNIQVILNTSRIYDNKQLCINYIIKNTVSISNQLDGLYNNIRNIELSCVTKKKALEFKLLHDKKILKNVTYTN